MGVDIRWNAMVLGALLWAGCASGPPVHPNEGALASHGPGVSPEASTRQETESPEANARQETESPEANADQGLRSAETSVQQGIPSVDEGLPKPPTLRLPETLLPRAYAIHLSLDPSRSTYSGDSTLQVEVQTPTSILWISARDLAIDGATVQAADGPRKVTLIDGGPDFVGLQVAPSLPVGPATLTFRFRGEFEENDTRGIFRQKEGDGWYVFTQLESTHAREVFPCLDEPQWKIPWTLSLTVPEGLTALSNTLVAAVVPEREGFKTVTFQQTAPLPSYLLALAVGPFEAVDLPPLGSKQIPHRIVTPTGHTADAEYAASIAPPLMGLLEDYFGMPYPYPKLDHIAIPVTVGFGAMENPGLITYGQQRLLLRDQDQTFVQRRRLATTMTHEGAHMWFGDLVTLEYWDDIWLNEGFATWMTVKIIERWKPEWEEEVARVNTLGRTMAADSLANARQVRQPILSEGDIRGAFDEITYGKGAALLHMFERWIGPERFQTGIRRYVREHALGTATSDDFLATVAAESDPALAEAFATFLNQPGVPSVSLERQCGPKGATLRLTQQRFLPAGSRGDQTQQWHIPVCLRVAGDDQAQRCTLMTEAATTLTLPASLGCPTWVVGNANANGYYRVTYSEALLAPLLEAGGAVLTLPERLALLTDLSAQVRAGDLSVARVLEPLPAFVASGNHHLIQRSAQIVGALDKHLVSPIFRPNYERYVQKLFGAHARTLSFTPGADEDEDTMRVRQAIVPLVANAGADPILQAEADHLARAWLNDRTAIHRELVGLVFGIAAIHGDQSLYDAIKAEALQTEERREQGMLLRTLGLFRDPKLASQALELLLDESLDIRQSQDILMTAMVHEATRERAYGFFKQHFEQLISRLPEGSRAYVPYSIASFCDPTHRADADAFLRPRITQYPGAERSLRQALESVELCEAYASAQRPMVEAYLTQF